MCLNFNLVECQNKTISCSIHLKSSDTHTCHSDKKLTLPYFSAMTRHTLRLTFMAVVVSVAMASRYCFCRRDSCYNAYGTCNAFLRTGESLTSRNGKARVTMEADGNLVVYCTQPRRAIWNSGTHGNTNNVMTGARFQDDGNLVLYNKAGGVLWAASSNGGYRMTMQDDANLVVYRTDGTSTWSTRTWGKCDSPREQEIAYHCNPFCWNG